MSTGSWGRPLARAAFAAAIVIAGAASRAESPAPVSGFSVDRADDGWTLGWTTPAAADPGVKVVVFARTDGRFPEKPGDGELLVQRLDPPGTTVAAPYVPPTNGETYSFSAFVVDPAGIASSPAHAEATVPLAPPGVVQNLRRTDLGR